MPARRGITIEVVRSEEAIDFEAWADRHLALVLGLHGNRTTPLPIPHAGAPEPHSA
jgi:hypothetical protein